ncbi:hypothetical protein ES703_100433 [subsurface metagenome]
MPPPAPPPALPRADIAEFDFEVTSQGPYNIGDTVTWMASGLYQGRRQAGRITISLGTGPVGTFFTRHTFPAVPLAAGTFPEAYDWTAIFISGSFILPGLELGQTYSIRARLEATEEPAQETDTDYGIITIAAAPPPPAPPPEEYPYVCEWCGVRFATEGELRSHQITCPAMP